MIIIFCIVFILLSIVYTQYNKNVKWFIGTVVFIIFYKYLTNHYVHGLCEVNNTIYKGGASKYKNIDIDSYGDGIITIKKGKVKHWFPPTKKPIHIVKESIYSITHYKLADKISKDILEYCKSAKTITDATANVGGNTISFSKHFKTVNSVEIDPMTCSALKKNIKTYNLKNVNVYCKSYLTILNDLTQDVIFIDPPWGGINYREKDNLMLYLGDAPIYDIINSLSCKVCVALKCPSNFDFDTFEKKVKVPTHKQRYAGWYVIYLSINNVSII
jgi:16S rRNA G966 N2-methylase RsmD